MTPRQLIVAFATALFAYAALPIGVARADCADPLQCICPFDQDFGAVGVIEDLRTEMSDNGFEIRRGTLRIESLSLAFEASPGRYAVGEVVELNPAFDSEIGDRVVATAGPTSTGMSVLQRVEDGSVTCASATFSEDEARELAVADDCREQVQDRVEIPECKDTVAPFDCSVQSEGRTAPGLASWLLLALGALAVRRRAATRSPRK